MKNKLHYNTVTLQLLEVLKELMQAPELETFRLVGGTALSLQRGHRLSVDIDLFTDALYGSINFDAIDALLRKRYPYVDTSNYHSETGMGRSYFIGSDKNECIKLDLFYTDAFIRPVLLADGIRLASLEEIVAMKMDVVLRGGRKKDFWDLHDLTDDYSFEQMLALHQERYPYIHDRKLLKKNFVVFENADGDFDPVCLKQLYWEVIKLDLIDFAAAKKGE